MTFNSPDISIKTFFYQKLLSWYQKNKRDLPFRRTKDPYKIWLSEIILQQTRVEQGLPYYEKFVTHFPTVQGLADAQEDVVLRLWQGLGYYSRARNLHAAAKHISQELGGTFPGNYADIKKLKGVGDYTAAAISSLAFGEPQAVLDGNVFRVLSRFWGVETDIASTDGKKVFRELAQDLIPTDSPADYNQAIMEFGALQCTPKKPNCTGCPLQENCFAYREKKQDVLPVKTKKTKVRSRFMQYVLFLDEDSNKEKSVLVRKRQGGDIWQGLYDFYVLESEKEFNSISNMLGLLGQELNEKIAKKDIQHESIIFKHQLSHRTLWVKFYQIGIKSDRLFENIKKKYNLEECNWAKLDDLPKPILISKYLDYLKSHLF